MWDNPEFFGATIVAGAALIASLLGVAFQAYAQSRAARLALLEKRLRVVLAADEVLQASRHLAMLPYTWVGGGKASVLAVRKLTIDAFVESHSSWEQVEGSIQFLFGREVEFLAREISKAARQADYAAELYSEALKDGTWGQEGPARERIKVESSKAANTSFRLRKKLSRTFSPYVAKEREFGLSWLEKAERRRSNDPPWWTEHS